MTTIEEGTLLESQNKRLVNADHHENDPEGVSESASKAEPDTSFVDDIGNDISVSTVLKDNVADGPRTNVFPDVCNLKLSIKVGGNSGQDLSNISSVYTNEDQTAASPLDKELSPSPISTRSHAISCTDKEPQKPENSSLVETSKVTPEINRQLQTMHNDTEIRAQHDKAAVIDVLAKPKDRSTFENTESENITLPTKQSFTGITGDARDTATSGKNAFAYMMNMSKLVFAPPEKHSVRFHLDENQKISLFHATKGEEQLRSQGANIVWSALVVLKNAQQEISVTLTSSILSHEDNGNSMTEPSTSVEGQEMPQNKGYTQRLRLVQLHSRLSVPVLKSVLQKSIRRQQAKRAVRVAMELADKDLGDLLRRLPIIALEDSMLHPDFGLLVWLMVAHSKEFELSPQLLAQVIQIVYEIASCPFKDFLPDKHEGHCNRQDSLAEGQISLSSTRIHPIVFCILVRAKYGGMHCDMEMLRKYANVWQCRFEGQLPLPSEVRSNLLPVETNKADGLLLKLWTDVPIWAHEQVRRDGWEMVSSLCLRNTRLERLRFEDICLEGVDNHCSSVIDHLLANTEIANLCHDLIIMSGMDHDVPLSKQGRRAWLEKIFKHCMWHFSAGINTRRALISTTSAHCALKNEAAYSELWRELLSKPARDFQIKYVKQRLAYSK